MEGDMVNALCNDCFNCPYIGVSLLKITTAVIASALHCPYIENILTSIVVTVRRYSSRFGAWLRPILIQIVFCRTPGGQAKLESSVKSFLAEAESDAKERRQMQKNGVWDEKMKATQTQSAYGVQCL